MTGMSTLIIFKIFFASVHTHTHGENTVGFAQEK